MGVDKQDRLSRNLVDFGILRDRLGCQVVSVKDPTDDTPGGHFMQDLNLAFAAQYSRNLSREVHKGMKAKFEAGGMVSRAPLGYLNVPRTRTEKAHVEAGPAVSHRRAPVAREGHR